MTRKWTKEIEEFLKANVKGRYNRELRKMIYEKFNVDFTESALNSKKRVLGLKSELETTISKYTPEVQEYIFNNYQGKDNIDLAKEVNEKFGLNLSNDSISNFKLRMKRERGINLRTGINRTRFKKGSIPVTKGKKWDEFMPIESQENSKKTWFKKGFIPKNSAPLYAERIRTRSDNTQCIKVKIANGKQNANWVSKQYVVWEKYYGKVPEGYLVVCSDGNNMNLDINNLILISKSESSIMNQKHLRTTDGELTKAGLNLVRYKRKINEIEDEHRR